MKSLWKWLKQRMLQYRFATLAGMALLGVGLMWVVNWGLDTGCVSIWGLNNTESRLRSSISLIILSLPVATMLWVFRTRDTREQINKAQAAINNSIFDKAIDMLLPTKADDTNSNKRKATALALLAKLRRENSELKTEIDLVTQNINLPTVNLNNLDLTGLDLFNAGLRGANLQRVKLQGANLSETNLRYATYNSDTKFPDGFDPQSAGMKRI